LFLHVQQSHTSYPLPATMVSTRSPSHLGVHTVKIRVQRALV
jgi:hypothetical protein